MPNVFDQDTAVRRIDPSGQTLPSAGALQSAGEEGLFEAEVSPDWKTGRGPHGGYLAAIVMRALIAAVDDPGRGARSFTMHFTRPPQAGRVTLSVKLERAGRSLSTLSARMEQDGNLIALVLSAFSVPWQGPEIKELPLPQVKPPDAERRTPEAIRQMGPQFMRHVVMQPRLGTEPASSGPMQLGGWLGFAQPRAVDPIALVFYADAWLPAPYTRLESFVPVPTVDLTVHFRSPSRISDPQELVLTQVTSTLIQEGFFEEDSVIWAMDGTVLAQSRQLGIVMSPISD